MIPIVIVIVVLFIHFIATVDTEITYQDKFQNLINITKNINTIYSAGCAAIMIVYGIFELIDPIDTIVITLIWTFIYNLAIRVAHYR